MKRIKLLQPCVTLNADGLAIPYEKGDEVTWEAKDADRLVKAGKAEYPKPAKE